MNHTWKRNLLMPPTNCVLNPHGSDETIEVLPEWAGDAVSFLTHTVQIKQGQDRIISKSIKDFLTHTVQMKLIKIQFIRNTLTPFLTHTVQIKHVITWHEEYHQPLLLNPHGSDETPLPQPMRCHHP